MICKIRELVGATKWVSQPHDRLSKVAGGYKRNYPKFGKVIRIRINLTMGREIGNWCSGKFVLGTPEMVLNLGIEKESSKFQTPHGYGSKFGTSISRYFSLLRIYSNLWLPGSTIFWFIPRWFDNQGAQPFLRKSFEKRLVTTGCPALVEPNSWIQRWTWGVQQRKWTFHQDRYVKNVVGTSWGGSEFVAFLFLSGMIFFSPCLPNMEWSWDPNFMSLQLKMCIRFRATCHASKLLSVISTICWVIFLPTAGCNFSTRIMALCITSTGASHRPSWLQPSRRLERIVLLWLADCRRLSPAQNCESRLAMDGIWWDLLWREWRPRCKTWRRW